MHMLRRTGNVPLNDGHWHHVGFIWSGITGEWSLLIDGVLWASRNVFQGSSIPSGGVLTIGKMIEQEVIYYLVGNITRMNLWSKAMTGKDIEALATSPESSEGDLIPWYILKDYLSEQRIIQPSIAAFSC